jgi:polysaccharide biosynthesis transport protein
MIDLTKRNGFEHQELQTQRREESVSVPQQRTLDAQGIIRSLRKRTLSILIVTLLVAIPSGVATYLTTPLYRSSALIQINPDPVQVLPYRDVADSATTAYYEQYMATQDQVLRGPSLGRRVAARLKSETGNNLLSAESANVSGRFEVRRVPLSQLFQIGYLAPSPEVAARVVNIFAEEYIKQHLESRRATRERARDSLQRELEVLEQRVQASENGLVSYAKRKNIVNAAPGQGDLVQTRLAALDQQVAAADAEVIVARTRLEALQKTTIKDFPERLVTPVVVTLTTQILQQEQELNNLRARFGENWPAVVAKRSEVGLLQQQQAREKAASLAQSTQQAQQDLQAAQSRLTAISNAMTRQKELVDLYNNALIQHNILRREVQTSQNLYEGVLERLRQTSVQGGLEFGNIQVLEPGIPSETKDSPRVWWNMTLASLLGLTLGVGVALLRDFWDNSVSTLEEVEEFTRLPGLGTIPSARFFESRRTGGPLGRRRITAPHTEVLGISSAVTVQAALPPPEVAESVRAVCASILLSQSDREIRVILVTSAIPAEGKTTVVCELGRALADSGAKTLLVDADMRKPALSEAFGIDSPDGLSLFLSGHAASPKVHETDQPNLFVVTAGPKPPNPVALLNSENMGLFLKEMASSFRFVLLDTPPVLAVADARVLGARADGVILVVRARHTSRGLIQRAQAILQNSGLNSLGAVLNGADDPQSVYYRRYYHPS